MMSPEAARASFDATHMSILHLITKDAAYKILLKCQSLHATSLDIASSHNLLICQIGLKMYPLSSSHFSGAAIVSSQNSIL